MKKLTESYFLDKCKEVNVIPLEKYTEARCKILVKDKLNIVYKVFSSSILQGITPTVMSAIDKNDSFIKRAQTVHGDKFDYSLVDYNNSSTKVKLICKQHGQFLQTPNQHINRRNICPKCVKRPGGYKRNQWLNQAKISNEMSGFKLYVVEMYNNTERFYKIGRTFRSVKRRFRGNIPYNYKVVKVVKDNGNNIYNLENKLHKILKEYSYHPKLEFNGCKECYEINNYISNIIQKI